MIKSSINRVATRPRGRQALLFHLMPVSLLVLLVAGLYVMWPGESATAVTIEVQDPPRRAPVKAPGRFSSDEETTLSEMWLENGQPGFLVTEGQAGTSDFDELLASSILEALSNVGIAIREGSADMAANIEQAMVSAGGGGLDVDQLAWMKKRLGDDAQIVMLVDSAGGGYPRVQMLDRRFGDVRVFQHEKTWAELGEERGAIHEQVAKVAIRALLMKNTLRSQDAERRVTISIQAFSPGVLDKELCDNIAEALEDYEFRNRSDTGVRRADSTYDRGAKSAVLKLAYKGRMRRLESALRKAISDSSDPDSRVACDIVGGDDQLWSAVFLYLDERPDWCEATEDGSDLNGDIQRLLRNANEAAEGLRFGIVVSSSPDLMTRAFGFEELVHEPEHDAIESELMEIFREFGIEVVDTAAMDRRRREGLSPFDDVDVVVLVRVEGDNRAVIQVTDRRTSRVVASFSAPDTGEVVRDDICTVEWDSPRSVARYIGGKTLVAVANRMSGQPNPLTVVVQGLPDDDPSWLSTLTESVEAIEGVGRTGIRNFAVDRTKGQASFSVPFRGQPDLMVREIMRVVTEMDSERVAVGHAGSTVTIAFMPDLDDAEEVVDAETTRDHQDVTDLLRPSVACATFVLLDRDGAPIRAIPVGTCWHAGDGWFATNAHVVGGLLKLNRKAQETLAEVLANGGSWRWAARLDEGTASRLIYFDERCGGYQVPDHVYDPEDGAMDEMAALADLQNTVDAVRVHPGYLDPSRRFIGDAAIIRVARSEMGRLGAVPALPLATLEEARAVRGGQNIHLGGFPMESINVNSVIPPLFVISGRVAAMANASLATTQDPAEARLIYFDATSAGGASGSPLLNDQGRVIGINYGGSYVFSTLAGREEDDAGNVVRVEQVVRAPSGFKYGARVDAIHELLNRH